MNSEVFLTITLTYLGIVAAVAIGYFSSKAPSILKKILIVVFLLASLGASFAIAVFIRGRVNSHTVTESPIQVNETEPTKNVGNIREDNYSMYISALRSFEAWSSGTETEEDMNNITKWLLARLKQDESILYTETSVNVPDTNSFLFANSETGYAFNSLEGLYDTVKDIIQNNQENNHAGPYSITANKGPNEVTPNNEFYIRISMSYVE